MRLPFGYLLQSDIDDRHELEIDHLLRDFMLLRIFDIRTTVTIRNKSWIKCI